MIKRLEESQSAIRALRDVGMLDPAQVAALAAAALWWGPSVAALYAAGAQRHPNRPALIDDEGTLTYGQLDRRSNRIVHGMRGTGTRSDDEIGILCRNGRGFVLANLVASKLGCSVVYLNTGFAKPQLEEVVQREGITLVFHDGEFSELVSDLGSTRLMVADDPSASGSLQTIGAHQSRFPPVRARKTSIPVLLTSGTTGTPKGARRARVQGDLTSGTAMFQRMPYRPGDRFVIAAPLFHAWGLSQLTLAATLGGTVVVHRRFDPVTTLDAVMSHRAQVLGVVPVMLRRMLDAAEARHTLPTLQITASSGSALPGDLGIDWITRFGLNLFNLYGSTEVGQATIASPTQLRAHPGTAGSVLPGTVVKVLDEHGNEAPTGSDGEIHVGSPMLFDGYTGGGSKESVAGLMSIGDVGHFDADGLLYVTGRADDMIISGGENVFPQEVEELLNAHEAVVEAAVHGIEDEEFGQRLRAVVVVRREVAPEELQKHVAERLARYKVPKVITFVDELPRNTTGKLLRRELATR